MGEGAQLTAGQRVEIPRGAQAEIRLTDGPVVRANERSALTLPKGDGGLSLERGEIVLLLVGAKPLRVDVGDDRLEVFEGEVLARRGETGNTFSVVSGRAELTRGDDTVSLGAGSTVSPDGVTNDGAGGGTDGGDADAPKPVAKRSLDVLRDTAWSADFDAVARDAELLPRGVGSLTARRAGSSVERQPLRLVDQKVTVTIDGRLAHTEVEQAFHNDSGAVMEGIYRFPLPTDASISGLSLLVGSRWMEGEMLEKQRARQIFREIVDATVPRDPALLQWEQGNVFKLNVFPIPARGERRIRLRYTQVLPESGEYVRYRFPMGGAGATGTEIEHFEMKVVVDDALEPAQIDQVRTPMMALSRRKTARGLELYAVEDHYLPTWDLGVDVPIGTKGDDTATVDTHLDRDGQAYFMATLRPGELPLPAPRPTSYAFVVDRSHGVAPELWQLSRAMVQTVLEGMSDRDEFTLLACDTACDAFAAGPKRADASTAAAALEFMDAQTLAGATDLGNMLRTGARSLDVSAGDRDRVVVYIGDGVPSSGALTIDELTGIARRDLGDARLLAVANGARSDLAVLDALARVSGGDALRADPRDDVNALVRELLLRARVPAARDLELEVPEGMFDVHPKQLPAVRPGDEITVVGRLAKPVHGEIKLRSRAEGGRVVQSFAVDAEAHANEHAGAHLPRTWAQHEIAHLTATRGAAARATIVALSRDYNVLSRWTALLVLENDAMYREFGVARKQDDKDAWRGVGGGKAATGTEVYGGAVPVEASEKAKEALPQASAAAETTATPELEPIDATTRTKGGEVADTSGLFDNRANGPLGGFDSDPAPGSGRASSSATRREREALPTSEEARNEEDDDGDDGDDWLATDDEAEPASSPDGRTAGSSKSSKPRKKMAAKPSRAPMRDFDLADPYDAGDGFGGGGGGGGYVYSRPRPRPKRRHVSISDATAPSERTNDRISALRSSRDIEPTNRVAHKRLVTQAVYAGHAEARTFAAAWAESDPDYAPALLAHADLLAAAGDPIAMRAYASAAEVRPFSSTQHRWLALAFASKGDWARSCSHRRALVSIDPADASRHVELARCLDHAGMSGRAKAAVVEGIARAKRPSEISAVADELGAGTPYEVHLHGSPDVSITLTWSGSADLDAVVVDRKGRRHSAMRPEKVRVQESSQRERLTYRDVTGAIHVEVTRADGGTELIRGSMTIKTPTATRSFPVEIDRGTLRVAKISSSWR